MRVYFFLFYSLLKLHWFLSKCLNITRTKRVYSGDVLIVGGYKQKFDYKDLLNRYNVVIVLGVNCEIFFNEIIDNLRYDKLVLLQMPFHKPLIYDEFMSRLKNFSLSRNFDEIYSNQIGKKTFWSSTSLVSALALVESGSKVDIIGVDYNDYILQNMPFGSMAMSLFRTSITSVELERISEKLSVRILNPDFYFSKAFI